MQTLPKAPMKAFFTSLAAGAMAVTAIVPAQAQAQTYSRDRGYDRGNGIGAGEIIAGAVILGGLAAVLSSNGKRDRYRYDYRGYRGDRRGYRNNARRGNPQRAIERCIRATERYANRASYGRANVTNVYDVDRRNNGWRIKGNIVLEEQRRGYRNRGYRGRNNGFDRGRFSCRIRNGRISDIDVDGIRGL